MPLVKAIPKGLQNGNVITEFTDTTNTTSVTYTFPTQQTSLIIENSGVKDIFVTVGSYTDQVINADKKWKVDVSFTSFSIRSDVNSQEFIATAVYKQVQDFTEVNNQINTITSQLTEKATIETPIDPTWEKWQDISYNYGFNLNQTRKFNIFKGTIESDTMLSVRGGKGRWNSIDDNVGTFVEGGHVFEGWNADNSYRLTMLVGKRAFSAHIQVFNPSTGQFGTVKIGSDEDNKGTDFSPDEAYFHTTLKTKNPIVSTNNVALVKPTANNPLEISGGTTGGTSNRDGSALVLYGDNEATNPGKFDINFGSSFKDISTTLVRFRYMSTGGIANVFTVDKSGNAVISGTVLLGKLASDPAVNTGAIYYNTTTNKFKGCENGVWVNLI